MKKKLPLNYVRTLVKKSLIEDKALKDATTNIIFKDDSCVKAQIISKAEGVFCGADFVKEVYKELKGVKLKFNINDGGVLKKNQKIILLEGSAKSILQGERTALNFIGFLSGISSLTGKFVSVAGKIKILDTRKTVPLYRLASKYAVLCGGGQNHRFDLKESVMIKDTHIKAAGAIEKCLQRICGQTKKHITVEIENINDLKKALRYKINRVLIDNTAATELKKMLDILPNAIEAEISGGITLKNIKSFSKLNRIDFISVGALTHSAGNFDFSMKVL